MRGATPGHRRMGLPCALLVLVLAAGCAARSHPSPPGQAPPSAAGRHALQDLRIREIMGRLALPLDRMPQELDPGSQRQRLLDEMAEVAAELKENAGRIPEVLKDVRMGEEYRTEFLDYARQLADRAGELGERARRGDLAVAQQTFREIDAICRQCHERFRVLPLAPPATRIERRN